MGIKSFAYSLCGPALLAGLIIACLLSGCRHSVNPVLAKADAIMEEHPDSALLILDDYRLGPDASAADSAYYALLLTQARYKNFIDETDDSLISVATNYYTKHSDDELASRSLFLKGMIQMNSHDLGEAAVSFRQGLDIAHEGKDYMWEGQCARGLCMLYGELYDGSSQVEYAKIANEAFAKIKDEGWYPYSKLHLARAYNNNLRYDESMALINELCKDIDELDDSLLKSEIYQLKGLVSFALGRYEESLESYKKACELDSLILTGADFYIIDVSLHETPQTSDTTYIKLFKKNSEIKGVPMDAFVVLAEEGNYKEAYEKLEQYKNAQDSVLSEIFSNNVSESMRQYEVMQETINKAKIKNERMIYGLIGLIIIIFSTMVIWYLRECMHKEAALRLNIEADLESLRSDFQIQLESARALSEKLSQYSMKDKVEGFEKVIRQHYADTNRLCDDYYQGRYNKANKDEIQEEVNKIVKGFTEKSELDEIIKFVDEKSGGMYSSFKKTFFNLTDEECRLFLYLILGFNSRSISVLIGQKTSVVYNRKARLKAKISNSAAAKKEEYLRFFGK